MNDLGPPSFATQVRAPGERVVVDLRSALCPAFGRSIEADREVTRARADVAARTTEARSLPSAVARRIDWLETDVRLLIGRIEGGSHNFAAATSRRPPPPPARAF
ncbi:hypothetical protein [Rathayibacter sp. VKM Ac-2760]|uniref:hypothetical protein n=1 Tax=Rathayibacter sp. VKM Ac-2760 TaxID=2609253 RepID=UPI001315D102|nr:hypothetical protein [Rathayibacter sp. VKM Ac-2760]QHC61141.1 hypothetical protein GSU72_20625 [Rathayibacter sp. VKM Ac-2760]